jgi:hypothetical protein
MALLQVQGLDAALRAMQNTAAQDTRPDQQQQQQATQLQGGIDHGQEQAAQLAAEQGHAGAVSGVGSSTDQQQQRSPGSVSSSPAQLSAEQSGMSASAAAERLQQQAQQLSDLLAHRDLTPAATAAAQQASSHSASQQVSSASQEQRQVQAGPGSSRGAGVEPLPCVAPLVLSPHFAGVGEALQDLAAWQLQQGLITPGQAVRSQLAMQR